MKNVTLGDIASKAGISKSAVSKALRGFHDISEDTRARVEAIAAEMGYQPNRLARSLRSGKSNMVGVLIPNNTNTYYSLILRGIEKTVREAGSTVVIINTNDDREGEKRAVQTLSSIPVDGIVAIPVDLQNYHNGKAPLVYVSRYPYRGGRVASTARYVLNDDFKGQYLAIRHLIEKGYRDIFLFMDYGPEGTVKRAKADIRVDAYRAALTDAGLPFAEDRVLLGVNTIDDSYSMSRRILELPHNKPAIAASNDMVALGILHAVHEKGLSIPRDIGVIGYDDTDVGRHSAPTLSTVHIAKNNMGVVAAQKILSLCAGTAGGEEKQVLLQPYIVPRNST